MINRKRINNPSRFCIVLFLACMIARFVEYFIIRTDESVLAENVLHKIFGIILLLCILKQLHWNWQDIGFSNHNALYNVGLGLLLGLVCFSISYFIEVIILAAQNKTPNLKFYVSGFSLTGEQVEQTGIKFILMCIAFNIINVWMEEGIFRGLYLRVLEQQKSFWFSNLLAALLFGIWHWVMPLRSYLDGDSSLPNLLIMGIGYIILSGIMSIKWGLLYNMTGSLWAGSGDHLFNNVIATNLIHVVSDTGADELQVVRILLAQLLSFVIVLIIYKKKRNYS